MLIGHRLSNFEEIHLSPADLERHVHCIGKTGSGKSYLLENMMIQMLEEGQGFCFVDIHGDSAKRIADAARDPIIYWKPADLSHTISLNPLENDLPDEELWRVVYAFVEMLKTIAEIDDAKTPRLSYNLRSALNLLVLRGTSTLLDIRRVFSDEKLRTKLLKRCTDRETHQTWEEFLRRPEKQQVDETASLLNKIAPFADAIPVRRIIERPHSTINIRRIMDTGVPLIIDLEGLRGHPAFLTGALVVTQFFGAALSRADIPEEERTPYTLIVDECERYGISAIADILSEARKYRLSLILANQFIEQLTPVVRAGIFGNVGTIISLKVGASDAELIAKELGRDVADDLKDLPTGDAWIKLRDHDAAKLRVPQLPRRSGYLESARRNTIASYARPESWTPKPLRNRWRQEQARPRRQWRG